MGPGPIRARELARASHGPRGMKEQAESVQGYRLEDRELGREIGRELGRGRWADRQTERACSQLKGTALNECSSSGEEHITLNEQEQLILYPSGFNIQPFYLMSFKLIELIRSVCDSFPSQLSGSEFISQMLNF